MLIFIGHAIPGALCLSIGISWTMSLCYRYFRCLLHGDKMKHFWSSSVPCPLTRSIPLNGIVMLSTCIFGICHHAAAGFYEGCLLTKYSHHMCIYFFFALYGFVEILMYYKVPLPKDSDYITLALAMVVQAMLFSFHLHGRNMLDAHIHTFLVYIGMVCAVAVLLEMRYRNNVHAALTKNFCFLLQGTWFFQIGFILQNPIPGAKPWNGDDHEEIMLVTSFFAWHMIGIVTFIAFTGFITWCTLKRSSLKINDAFTLLDNSSDEQSSICP